MSLHRIIIAALAATVLTAACDQLLAQDFRSRRGQWERARGDAQNDSDQNRDGGRGNWGRGRGGGRRGGNWGGGGRGGFDPSQWYKQMDRNENGMLDPDELDGRTKMFVDRTAQQAGLDTSKPIPIDKLTEAFEKLRREREEQSGRGNANNDRGDDNRGRNRGDNDRGRGGRGDDDDDRRRRWRDRRDDDDDRRRRDRDDDEQAEPLVSGFGEEVDLPEVPGFGETAAQDDNARGNSTRGSRSAESNDDDSNSRRDAASAMLRQYDRNDNGTLERDEWGRMRGDMSAADANRDGKITRDELAAHLENWGQRRGAWRGRGDRDNNDRDNGDRDNDRDNGDRGRRSRASSGASGDRMQRYLTPTERLPEGLPSWFVRNDADGDGQVMMHEFASNWTDSEAARFAKYDLDGDGVLTPAECLQAD